MRILFVVDRHPFPPRDGVSLPVAKLALGLARSHSVDVAVLGREAPEAGAAVPSDVDRISYLGGRQGSGVSGLLDELLLRRPRFEWRGFSEPELEKILDAAPYDLAWISPLGCMGLLRAAGERGHSLARASALGLNDAATTLYMATVTESLRRGGGLEWARLLRWLRLPWIWHHERQALRGVDVVHVQTPLEDRRLERILGGREGGPWVLTAQNGRNTGLESLERSDRGASEPVVLLTAHLGPDPAPGAWWFLESVWPLIRERKPDAELELVGRLPDEARAWLPEGVSARGLVDDLAPFFRRARVAVVPMFRSTGLVNRALDALTAGVPLVTTSQVLATIRGAVEGEHALAGEDPEGFADAVVSLLEDQELAHRIAAGGRALALDQPTWEETVAKVERTLVQVVEKGKTLPAGTSGR